MFLLGIDVGATTIKSSMTNIEGNIICSRRINTPKNSIDFYKEIENSIMFLSKKAKVPIDSIHGIGIGVPGPVSSDGVVKKLINIGLENEDLEKQIKIKFPNSLVKVANDAYVAALAEKKIGVLEGCTNGLLLTLGTGVGSSIIINKQIIQSKFGYNPEAGHMFVGNNFYNCNCGKNGCLETFCSSSSLVKHYEYILSKRNKKNINKKINSKMIFDEYENNNNDIAIQVIERFTEYLSIGISNLYNLFLPEVIAIGGGISVRFDLFYSTLDKKVRTRIFNKYDTFSIRKAKHYNEAGVIGAAFLNL